METFYNTGGKKTISGKCPLTCRPRFLQIVRPAKSFYHYFMGTGCAAPPLAAESKVTE
ncbi:hypothetical protein LJC64_01500 [Ruminococcaceae bacterium OttesenSCG-928-A11]|nr:hypothetical protein [Ruminococcaceae bacterium OttesenSCG-928-A11]